MPRFTNTLVLISSLLAGGAVIAAERVTVDRVAAVIENDIVTMRELEAKAAPYMEQLGQIGDPAMRESKRKEILRQVLDIEIGERIVDKEIESNQDKLGVTDKDVDRAIEEVLRINSLTRDQLRDALYRQGITWSEYRKKLREQIERARLIQFKVQGKVQIKDTEVQRRCRDRQSAGKVGLEVCAAHILLTIPEDATAEQTEALRAKVSKLQAEVSAGADFSAYALEHSADKSAPDGNIGCFGRGEMVQEFEDAAFALEVGDVSPVVRTEFGFHIIRVSDRRHPASPCETEPQLTPFRNELYQEEMERQMNLWILELRQKAFVEVRI